MMKFSGPVKISEKIVASEKIFSLDIISPEIASSARPGQFIQIKVPGMDSVLWPRPFSVHKVSGKTVTISVKKCGITTEFMSNLERGDELFVTGPLGNGFKMPMKGKSIYLVAGGVGLPPLHFLCEYILKQGYPRKSVRFYSGARCANELFANDELASLGIDYKVTTDDGSYGMKGYVTEPFAVDLMKERAQRNHDKPEIYSCGPMAMMKKMAEICRGMNCYLSLEQLMPCGWGACNGCAVKVKVPDNDSTEDERGFRLARACREGPVFKASELIWD